MAAKIVGYSNEEFDLYVRAEPAGEYGFGTLGAANADLALAEAWRMVQRAGLAKVADRASGRVVVNGARSHVAYGLVPHADLSAVPSKVKGY